MDMQTAAPLAAPGPPPNTDVYHDALGRPAGTIYYDSLGHRRVVTPPQFIADDGTVTCGHEPEAANAEHYAKIEGMRANRTLEQREAAARYYEHLNAELDRLMAAKRERGWKPGEAFDFSAEWREASRSAAMIVIAGLRGRRGGSRQRPRGAGRPRARAAQRSSAESGDSGSDSDEPEPPHWRLCPAPWCDHPVYGTRQTYCGTERCNQARAAERQRKRRRGDDLTALERELLADARAAGYVGSEAFAEPGEEHSQTFLWKFGLIPGGDPGEFYALAAYQRVCRCNGHHIDGGAVGCLKCGMPRTGVA